MSRKKKKKSTLLSKFLMRYQGKQLFCIVGAFVFITLWLGGMISQLAGSSFITGDADISLLPFHCIAALFTHGIHGLLFVIFIYFAIAALVYIKWKDKNQFATEDDARGFKIDGSGTHGTSALMKPEDLKDVFCEIEPLDRTHGIILGKYSGQGPKGQDLIVSIPLDGKHYKYNALGQLAVTKDENGNTVPVREKLAVNGNQHMTIIGNSGSGKSYCMSTPAILQIINAGESAVVTDPKGELYGTTSAYAEEHGYTVKILNLAYPPASDSWDALGEIEGSQLGIEAQNFANIIINNTSNPNAKGDEIYANGEKNLLVALILFVLTSPKLKAFGMPKTLGTVYWLLSQEDTFLETMLGDTVTSDSSSQSAGGQPKPKDFASTKPYSAPWQIYNTASPALKGNLKLGLGVRLQTLQDETIRNITGIKDIDLTLPGKSKCIYYVILSDMNNTFKFISSLFFSCLFSKLVEFSRKQKTQKLPVPVHIIMDEFIAIGQLPDFDKKLATVRSARINIYMIFQTLAQLQESYPNGVWETLISCCYTFMCLSCGNDMGTAEYLSKRAGTMTTALENLRVDRPTMDIGYIPSSMSHSYSQGERAVLQPVEIIKLAGEDQKALIMLAGADVFAVEKFGFPELVNPAELKIVNMYEHCPAWVMKEQYQPKYSDDGVDGIDDMDAGYQKRAQNTTPSEPPQKDIVNAGFDGDNDEESTPEHDDIQEAKPITPNDRKRRGIKPKSNASPESQARIHDF